MPGPKMGPRPADFDEAVIRQSPTFLKWMALDEGAKLRYACREFCKGHGDDEERLMRRIMIARRNNLRDHAMLKKARSAQKSTSPSETTTTVPPLKKRRTLTSYPDTQVAKDMDVSAVEATRSYRKWTSLADGEEFTYNQKYTKGAKGHDWLLRKNIWRRMRYRRENKKLVQGLKGAVVKEEDTEESSNTAAGIVDHALLAEGSVAAAQADDYKSAVEAAVAAAEQFSKGEGAAAAAAAVDVSAAVESAMEEVTGGASSVATDAALDAAAKLAAASAMENAAAAAEEQVDGGVALV